jgi:Asp-tRNA(Asn)/Glu-tRNA(Gln) amidotransferase C subunit
VKKAAPVIKEKLAEHLTPLKEMQASLCDATKCVKSAKSDIEKQGAIVATSIEQSFQELHEIIERRKRELLEKTSLLAKGKLDRLNVQEKEFEMVSGTIQSLVEFVEQNIENAMEEELMTIHTQILNRIDEETKKNQQSSAADLKPVEEADIMVGVECAEELKTLCHEKAVVTTSPADLFKLIVPKGGISNVVVDEASKVKLQVFSYHMQHKKPMIVKAKLTSSVTGAVVLAKVEQKSDNTYEIEYTPSVQGRHQLTVTIGDLHVPVAGSPFPVFVHIPPTQLGKPLKIIPDLNGFGTTFNSRGELVFAERLGDILFLDKSGNPSRRITKSQHGFQSLFGVAVDDDDSVYVTDDGCGKILKFDKQCVKVKAIKPAIEGLVAHDIAVFGDYVIVADFYNHQLLVFTRDLCLEKTIDCQTGQAVGVACDQDGSMYVCNYGDNCIQVFNTQGVLLYSFREKGSTSHKLDHPHSICVSGDLVYVTEWGDVHCVSVFTKKGKFITSFGKKGSKEGELNLPSGLAVDSDGVLYVCDLGNRRLQVF